MISVKTILFVENDPVSQTMYQKRLEREGFHLECAPDGQVALDILSERAPDLVLLDLMLPKVSGADVLKFMNADPRLTTVPVIIFSNAPMTEVPPDSPLARGAKRLLKSDCTFPKLLETIQETLAAAPEFVVIEADKTSAAQSNGQSKGGRSSITLTADSETKVAPEAKAASETKVVKQRAEFLKEALPVMPKVREHSMGYIKAPESAASQTHLSGLHQRVHLLNTAATQADCARVALLTNTFDALLTGIIDKPSTVTPSVLQTIAQAVDGLDGLLKNKDGYSTGPAFQARVLVVDDDTVCNHVNVTSLKRVNFDTVGVKDPAAALSLLETTEFDLVVLDINMPGMTGFDVCEKMRRLPHCKKTPVIFVTAFSNFDNRKQSVLSGGNDFVTKPVSPLELALKVTVNLIKARVQGVHTTQLQTSSAAVNGSSHASLPAAKTKPDLQANAETEPPAPPSRLAPTAGLGARDAKTANPLPEISPEPKLRPASTPQSKASPPASPPGNGKPQSGEIVERLRQSTAALEQAKAGLEQESAERSRNESQWREQLNEARALLGQTGGVIKEKEVRCGQLEKELAELRQGRDELQNKLKIEQQATAKSQQEIKEIQERLRQGTAELESTKAALEKQSAERTRLEAEWREQLNAAKAAAGQMEAALKEKMAQSSQLEKELAGLRQVRDELQNKFTTEQQAVAKAQHEIKELQAGLGQQAAEKIRLESEWREQLNAAKASVTRTETTLKEKEARCGQLEKELGGLQQVRDELQNKFTTEQKAVAKAQQEIKELQERQRQSAAELERAKTGLEQQSAERTRLESKWREQLNAAKTATGQMENALKEKASRCGQLETDLAGVQQARNELQNKFAAEQQATAKSQQEIKGLNERLQQSATELERTKAGLEQESAKRARLESEHQSLAAAREALNLELRGLRESQAAREAELRDRQRKLAEGLRENIQLLQSRLQEAEAFSGDSNGAIHGKSNGR
jgi:DNA-binding response OmpR family regulator/ribosomal protein L34E